MTNLLTARVSGQEQLAALVQSLNKALDTREILDEGAALLFNNMRTRFLMETDPTGKKWQSSAAAIRRHKTGRGGGTLYNTGKMFRGLQIYAESDTSRAIGLNVTSPMGFPYPKMHNYGLGGMLQRQFLGFGTQDLTIMSQLIVRRLTDALTIKTSTGSSGLL